MKPVNNTVSGAESVRAARALLKWFNSCGLLPKCVGRIEAEYLSSYTSMGLFSAAAPVKTKSFISGAYEAQFQFSLQYRTAAASSEDRLNALDTLSAIAAWAEQSQSLPKMGRGLRAIQVERSSPAVLAARYDDGSEDYQILMVLSYQANPYHLFY